MRQSKLLITPVKEPAIQADSSAVAVAFSGRQERNKPFSDQLASDHPRENLLRRVERPARIELTLKPWQG